MGMGPRLGWRRSLRLDSRRGVDVDRQNAAD